MVNLPGLAGSPPADRCLVMGVVNVTPDSFSDGGQWFGARAAVEHGLELIAQGADIVDVGGESTRPGAQRVSADEELRRVKPVITELVRAGDVVSVDTMRAQVAEWAVEAGVSLVNDVSGGLADPYMPRLVAKACVPYVVMHWRGHSHDMYSRAELRGATAGPRGARRCWPSGSTRSPARASTRRMIVLVPGLRVQQEPCRPAGRRRTTHSCSAGLPRGRQRSAADEFPGWSAPPASATSKYGSSLVRRGLVAPVPSQVDAATAAITALAAAVGAWCVRVHQVPANADAVRVAAAYRAAARA